MSILGGTNSLLDKTVGGWEKTLLINDILTLSNIGWQTVREQYGFLKSTGNLYFKGVLRISLGLEDGSKTHSCKFCDI